MVSEYLYLREPEAVTAAKHSVLHAAFFLHDAFGSLTGLCTDNCDMSSCSPLHCCRLPDNTLGQHLCVMYTATSWASSAPTLSWRSRRSLSRTCASTACSWATLAQGELFSCSRCGGFWSQPCIIVEAVSTHATGHSAQASLRPATALRHIRCKQQLL